MRALGISVGDLRDIGEELSQRDALTASEMARALESFPPSQQRTIIGSFLLFGGDASIASKATALVRPPAKPSPARIAIGVAAGLIIGVIVGRFTKR